jgi:hypothetical protein
MTLPNNKEITVHGLINYLVSILVIVVGTLLMMGINDIRDSQKKAAEFQIQQTAAIEKINGRIDVIQCRNDDFEKYVAELKQEFIDQKSANKRLDFQIDQLKVKKLQTIK